MIEFKRVMVAIDGSEESYRALEHAVYICHMMKAELYLAAVVDMNRFISAFELVSTSGYVPSEAKKKGENRLKRVMHLIPEDITVHQIVDVGSPSELLVDIAESNEIDLVCIGRRGKSTLERLTMGSVSSYMVANAHCPVLVIR